MNHVVVHRLDPVDDEIVAAARVATGPMKGTWRRIGLAELGLTLAEGRSLPGKV
jgi:hypothetical protein